MVVILCAVALLGLSREGGGTEVRLPPGSHRTVCWCLSNICPEYDVGLEEGREAKSPLGDRRDHGFDCGLGLAVITMLHKRVFDVVKTTKIECNSVAGLQQRTLENMSRGRELIHVPKRSTVTGQLIAARCNIDLQMGPLRSGVAPPTNYDIAVLAFFSEVLARYCSSRRVFEDRRGVEEAGISGKKNERRFASGHALPVS